MKNYCFSLLALLVFSNARAQDTPARYPLLFNMVHHNPGEPFFETQYAEPAYLKTLGYNGQIPRFFVQCGLTYDDFEDNIVPRKSAERIWIEREAANTRVQINNAEKARMPLYPFTDMLVVPKSIFEKYKDSMSMNGRLSILREKTQEIVRAQMDEIFKRFPKLAGLTIRHGETYLFDTPFHNGNSPAKTPEEHIVLINILRDEICVKRNKTLIYRTWDFGDFHTRPDFYLTATNAIEPHALLFFSIKHTNNDFLRGVPFNTTVGIGKHQQIVELSTNQAGIYGRSSHPYYIGRGIIEGWSEMNDHKKGIRDLYNDPKIKGFWIWTWGDGWVGPYFDNELWINLNEFILRDYALNPNQKEEDIFEKYTSQQLKLKKEDRQKLRELCMLSEDAVYYGQASEYFKANAWWCRDHYLTAINLNEVAEKGLKEKVLAEKRKNIEVWYRMERISKEIKMPNPDDEAFLRVSTTYGRIKYEVMELIWQLQIMMAENKAGQTLDRMLAKQTLLKYDEKWKEWEQLRKDHPSCPTLYSDNTAVNCGPPFQESVTILKNILEK